MKAATLSSPHGEVLCSCKASNHEGVTRCLCATTSWFEAREVLAPHHEVYCNIEENLDV